MSARIPHLLTHLLSSDDLDVIEAQFRANCEATVETNGGASLAWQQALQIIVNARRESFIRRSKLTPSARRKSLGLRYTR